MSEKLAIHGGPKAVTASGEDRHVKFDVEEVKRRIGELLDGGTITIANGTGVVAEFEQAFREKVGTRYALAMNNGTATLDSAYFAVGVGPRPGCERGGYLEFKFKVARDVADRVPLDAIEKALQAEGAPVHRDRYSNINYTYGLLHKAPLFTTFDRTQIGGCFYDPTRYTGGPVEPVSLPVTEDVCTRLLSTYAFVDVDEQYLLDIADAFRKVMTHLDQVA